MTALSNDANRQRRGQPRILSVPMAVEKIYKGALVAINASGYATATSLTTAGYVIVGVAAEQMDNSGGSAGDKRIRVESGAEFLFTASSITQAMLGNAVYVVDNNTVDDSGTNNIYVGQLVEYVSTTQGWVFIPNPGVQMEVGLSPAVLNTAVVGVAGGYKIARGQLTTVTATDTVVTGLSTVVAAIAQFDDNPGDDPNYVSCTIGDQAGSPAAGSIIIKTWKNTGGTDPTPLAATTFSKKINWIAIGT